VTAINGTAVTLSQATTAALSGAPVVFTMSEAAPAILAVGVGS
jgi:hypothetical protein